MKIRLSFMVLALTLVVATGCVERKMVITSEPSGATVTINQTWTGKTPYELKFKHYGTYDIMIEKQGYFPMRVAEPVAAPGYEQPGVDFVSEVMIPKRITDVRELHYKLSKVKEEDNVDGIMERGEKMKREMTRLAEERAKRDEKRQPKRAPLPVKPRFRKQEERRLQKEAEEKEAKKQAAAEAKATAELEKKEKAEAEAVKVEAEKAAKAEVKTEKIPDAAK